MVGVLYSADDDWDKPNAEHPDGSYAIFRGDSLYLEVLSDPAASRTIWYYFDQQQCLASTSQRMLIAYLGHFQFDERVIPWMLSTGTLGPELGWDKRIKRLPPESSLLLNKATWELKLASRPIAFRSASRSRYEHKDNLSAAISETVKSLLTLDYRNWVLTLSGGYDARAILQFLLRAGNLQDELRTVTWGLEKSQFTDGNDAKIAKDLAEKLRVRHDYLCTDTSSEPLGRIVNRFLACGEGRVDHIAGYMDGLDIWRVLRDDWGVAGVIRGDEGFGWTPVASARTARIALGCSPCSDFENLDNVISRFHLSDQSLPRDLEIMAGETVSAWRDRLYHSHRIPTILAALSDIKLSYVEVISPLLSRRILECVRVLPDELRTNKELFKEVAQAFDIGVPYATAGANEDRRNIFRTDGMVQLVKGALQSAFAKDLFGGAFVEFILGALERDQQDPKDREPPTRSKGKLRRGVKSLLPLSLRFLLKDSFAKPRVDGHVLAFRMFIVLKMHQMLNGGSWKS